MYRTLVPMTLALAIIAIVVLVALDLRRPGPLDQDMADLIWWIAERTHYSAQVPLPRVRFLPREEINRRHYSLTESGYRGQRDIVAFYEDVRKRITLPSTFDIRRDQDTLVHELVHHLQNVHGMQFRCPAEREREAYLIQARFVAETGIGTMPTPGFIASLRC
jgi:hypothetical protein